MDKISLIPLNFEKSSSFVKIAKNIELNDKNLSMQLKKSGQRRLRVETNAQVVKTSSELHTKITFEEIAEIVAKYRCPPAQAIFSAARSGDLKSVKKLIAFDVDIKIHGDRSAFRF